MSRLLTATLMLVLTGLTVRAQQPAGRVYRVGHLSIPSREQSLPFIKAFEEGLRSLSYRIGENVVIEYRFASGQMDRLPANAADRLERSLTSPSWTP